MSDYLTFKPTILYALAAPSTPNSVVEKAIAQAESGEKVTVADVKDWKALGYESFKDYGEKSFEWTEARLYQLVDAAEISLQLGYDSTIVESQPKERESVTVVKVKMTLYPFSPA